MEAGDEAGVLFVTHLGQREQFVEIEPGLYRNVDPENSLDPYGTFETIVFQEGTGGSTVLLADGPMSYTKAPWYATSGFTAAAVLIPVLLFIGTGLTWVVQGLIALIRKGWGALRPMAQTRGDAATGGGAVMDGGRAGRAIGRHSGFTPRRTRSETVGKVTAAAFAVATLGLLIGAVLVNGDMEPAYGVPKSYFGIEPDWASSLDVLPPIMVVLAVTMIASCIMSWRRGPGGREGPGRQGGPGERGRRKRERIHRSSRSVAVGPHSLHCINNLRRRVANGAAGLARVVKYGRRCAAEIHTYLG